MSALALFRNQRNICMGQYVFLLKRISFWGSYHKTNKLQNVTTNFFLENSITLYCQLILLKGFYSYINDGNNPFFADTKGSLKSEDCKFNLLI